MQKHTVTRTTTDTDALFAVNCAAMAPRLGDLARRQIQAGLARAAGTSARLAAHNAFIADPTLRDERGA